MRKVQPLSVFEVLKQVITSWQVIAVTVAIVIFLHIVFYVSRRSLRPTKIHKLSFRKKKPAAEPAQGPEEVIAGSSDNEELGLEEE